MSRRTRKAALIEFSEDKYLWNFKNAIQQVISHARGNQKVSVKPFFGDENRNVAVGQEAMLKLSSMNDKSFLRDGQGIIEINIDRWKEAQRYERRAWMEGYGRSAQEDRNSKHKRDFSNYAVIQGMYFDKAIEIGCGPFTNMVHILKYIKCGVVTLLDPLSNDYLSHPHCTYKHKHLGGWFGKKVHIVAEPIENFAGNYVFDLVVMINVLEHCFSAPKVFERIISLTAPGGILIFHDKLIPSDAMAVIVQKIYDAGHPLRVAKAEILEFLSRNYDELFSRHVAIPSDAYTFDSIYFIGRKRIRQE
jgi:SAM-dependent methyltransferase